MSGICPYCNGLIPLAVSCPSCGTPMDDQGTLQEELGPYAPYEENTLIHSRPGCAHRVYCPNCRTAYYYSVWV